MRATVAPAFLAKLEARIGPKATNPWATHLPFGGIDIIESTIFPFDSNCAHCAGTGEGRTSTFCLECEGRGRFRTWGMIEGAASRRMIGEPIGTRRFDPAFPPIYVPPPKMKGLI